MNEPKPKPDDSPWGQGANPFSDVPPAQGAPFGANPYGSPQFSPMVTPEGYRGDSINSLAITGLVFSIIGIACCGIFGIVGLAIAIPAYLMAQADLQNFQGSLHPVLLGKLTTSKNLALAGIIVGGLGLLMGCGFAALQIAIIAMDA